MSSKTHPTIRPEGYYYIEFGIDQSCNLACPSCRKDIIFDDSSDAFKERLLWVEQLKQWINNAPSNADITLLIGGNGEAFASPVYLNLLQSKFENNNVTFHIRSNGTLLKRHFANLNFLDKLRKIEISIDAATKKTYEQVRRPAKWNNLIANIDFLVEQREKFHFSISGNFVIQKSNLDDVLFFIKWCRQRNIKPNFTLLQNWASFSNFDEHCVHRPTDTLYGKFLQIIQTPEFKTTEMSWTKNYF